MLTGAEFVPDERAVPDVVRLAEDGNHLRRALNMDRSIWGF